MEEVTQFRAAQVEATSSNSRGSKCNGELSEKKKRVQIVIFRCLGLLTLGFHKRSREQDDKYRWSPEYGPHGQRPRVSV